VQAVSLFVYTQHIGEYFAGISLPEGRAFSAALLWRGAIELARRGVPQLNLGGGVTRGDGIAEFKERFGAQRIPLYSLKQVYDRDAYRELCHAAGTDPDARAGFFPSFRARR
jgi:lipid II:glycine glycyltransferase (peptidoglycan interpeptide bridge formation enzyme)